MQLKFTHKYSREPEHLFSLSSSSVRFSELQGPKPVSPEQEEAANALMWGIRCLWESGTWGIAEVNNFKMQPDEAISSQIYQFRNGESAAIDFEPESDVGVRIYLHNGETRDFKAEEAARLKTDVHEMLYWPDSDFGQRAIGSLLSNLSDEKLALLCQDITGMGLPKDHGSLFGNDIARIYEAFAAMPQPIERIEESVCQTCAHWFSQIKNEIAKRLPLHLTLAAQGNGLLLQEAYVTYLKWCTDVQGAGSKLFTSAVKKFVSRLPQQAFPKFFEIRPFTPEEKTMLFVAIELGRSGMIQLERIHRSHDVPTIMRNAPDNG